MTGNPEPGTAARRDWDVVAALRWDPETETLISPDRGPLGYGGDLEDQIVAYARGGWLDRRCGTVMKLRRIDGDGTRVYTVEESLAGGNGRTVAFTVHVPAER